MTRTVLQLLSRLQCNSHYTSINTTLHKSFGNNYAKYLCIDKFVACVDGLLMHAKTLIALKVLLLSKLRPTTQRFPVGYSISGKPESATGK